MTSAEVGLERRVGVALVRGQERVASVLRWRTPSDHIYPIDLDGPDGPLAGSGNDLFEALREIRLELEPRGWSIAVQGAREDAYASGMVRDMIGARRVYLLRPGRHVEREHLVDIFAEAPVDRLGTVEQQASFFRAWRLSLGR